MRLPKSTVSILSALFLLATPLSASDWSGITAVTSKSIVFVQSKAGSCTGFVINSAKNYVLTAAHCDGEELYVDQSPAKIISKDQKKDLLVLEVHGLDRPALKLATADPLRGQEVASDGYGYGLDNHLLKIHHIADTDTHINEQGIGGPLIVVDSAFLPGMSGGPVVDGQGKVVAIVQRGTDAIGMGVPASTIKSKMGRYFE